MGPDITTMEGMVDALKQCFETARVQAYDQLHEQQANRARLHFAEGAAYAGLLALYYRAIEDQESAERWSIRRDRYHVRAYQRRNSLVENLGGTMR